MGVGVFKSDFNGTGGTFIVDAILIGDEDYRAYRADVEASGDEPLSEENWRDDESLGQDQALAESISEACQALGLPARTNFQRHAQFEHDFRVLSRDFGFVVGCRGWEIDTIVGVWQDERYGVDAESWYADIASEQLVDPARFVEVRQRMAQTLLETVRLFIQESGRACSYKTSPWTTARYALADDFDAQLERLAAQFSADLAFIRRPAPQALREEGIDNFKSLLKVLSVDAEGSDRAPASVGYLRKGDSGVLWAQIDADLNVEAFVAHGGLTAEELGLSTDFDEDLRELPATESVLRACIERAAGSLERHNKVMFDVPPATWLEVAGEEGPIHVPSLDDETYDDPIPGM